VIPNASITTHNLGTGATSNGTSDDVGRYLITHLQPGTYFLELTASGFTVYKVTSVTVEVGRVTTVDAALGVKTLTETVVATAEAPSSLPTGLIFQQISITRLSIICR